MKPLLSIAAFTVVIALFPLVTDSGVHLNFVMMALYAGLMGMAWNVLAGFGGQFSFGHALFFGFGAYIHIIAQLSWGINPWFAIFLAIAVSALLGAVVGALSFRYGLKGSYFALVTLAFAEVARILALSVDITGGGVGLMLPLKPSVANMQFESRLGYYYM
ncbi:MAG: branched-chain amino acid ABC transporter permease, partial [Burkholderiaceae bacterium]